MSEKTQSFSNLADFYPFYLSQHQNPWCRFCHFLGLTLVLANLLVCLLGQVVWPLCLLPIWGYGCAWMGHYVFEKNRPATFQYPLYSLLSDWVMYKDLLMGREAFFPRKQ